MEAVKSFNNELYSLNEYKPPISKAKMTQITKSGIKAIKLSQLPQSTESEAGGWGGESYKEIRESLTSLGRRMGCFKRKMEDF
ncbi:protein SCAF8-like isoform X2 [Notothenia coriiceps]|uniref:Protein SCAF8-like isoform X2 n=1 Tax=Notothenia coriiceps TaxID=8208 RepID=A0A6I9P7M2_9TELE|nr:PREDICTED: protein SCAF8-like isoform X2 [Notothenia coriiceps]